MRSLTPLKAIRAKCLECGNGQYIEVKLCPVETCPLYPLRFGKGIRGKGISPLKAIRKKCLDCGEGTYADVKNCNIEDCPIYSYRFGKNPNLKGKRGQGNEEALRQWHLKSEHKNNKRFFEESQKGVSGLPPDRVYSPTPIAIPQNSKNNTNQKDSLIPISEDSK